ncbi:MAG: T9SS type A sorting domain-containing protein, partial [Flavobacteriaceae bacterium]|nr:T9SS type A sorting domain-containing protein [Flavobacteriaceae bacterium]
GNMGNEYVHQHRLIHMVTGQWGESISPTTTGSFIDRTYTYTIPADYNGIACELEDLELVVFMTETTQELISGNGSFPTYSNFPFQNDVTARYVVDIPDNCGFELEPQVNIQNTGENPVTSLDIDYSVNGGPVQTYTWTGNLTSLQNETVTLPAISYDVQEVNTVTVTLQNDEDNSNNTTEGTFNRTEIVTNELTLLLNTDGQGAQVSWEILDTSNNVVDSGSGYGNNQNLNIPITTPGGGCYQFNLYDTGGNGGGSVVLYDTQSNVIYQSSGDYGEGGSANFATEGFLGTGDAALSGVSIYPNPASQILNVVNAENASVLIYDLLGREVVRLDQIEANQTINVAALQSGTYLVKIAKDNAIAVEKLVISK